MDKIKDLMQKCDIRPEVADRLCEGIENYLSERRAQQDAEFKKRQEEAKRVCLEEVDQYKKELARRLQIFCEARGAEVQQTVAKQTAVKESEVLTKFQAISEILDGVVHNGEQNGDLQAENKNLKRRLTKLSEDNRRAVHTANRNSALAAKVLERNRLLETQMQRLKKSDLQEENSRPQRRLDTNRRGRPSGNPVTTRATLRENQDRNQQRQQQPPVVAPEGPFTPDGIARMMEPDLV